MLIRRRGQPFEQFGLRAVVKRPMHGTLEDLEGMLGSGAGDVAQVASALRTMQVGWSFTGEGS
jgi:hypothetical protein